MRPTHKTLPLAAPSGECQPSPVTSLSGKFVTLRTVNAEDIPTLAAIRAKPEVYARWSGEKFFEEIADDLVTEGLQLLVVERQGIVIGMIQWSAEEDPKYRHAHMDLFLEPAVHARGMGADAVRTLARHLVDDLGHHRLVIETAADNVAAIKCYTKVGFRPVGMMRHYERGNDGSWHDGLLMELLAEDLVRDL